MADDVEFIALARERILETFQIDLQREAPRNVSRRPRRVPSSTNRVGKVFDFSIRSEILRHREAEMCEVDRPCNFSSRFVYVRPSLLSKISRDKCLES